MNVILIRKGHIHILRYENGYSEKLPNKPFDYKGYEKTG